MEILFWTVLIVGGGLTLTRLPGLSKSRNQSIFLSGLCACAAFGLMIPGIYEGIEQYFDRTNFTDLFAKLALLLAVNILVCEIAKTLRCRRALRFTAGLPGKTILVLTFALEMMLFAFTSTPLPSPGLGAYIEQPLVLAYNAVIVIYIGYLGTLVIGPLIRDARTPPQPPRRLASVFLAIGFGLAIVRAALMLGGFLVSGWYEVGQITSGLSALAIVAGLTTAWAALRVYGAPKITQSQLRVE